ncbi:hypothetical protein OUZ56_028362 [Daphnia magna]|uniref:Uncharacterized protein n=1 Tax=Daphnia magna TaxID=35525 RepID=A0ABR0B3M5_9CRUS|nr:hypothetical protein OUZ56_028362 [Daphnia magna]
MGTISPLYQSNQLYSGIVLERNDVFRHAEIIAGKSFECVIESYLMAMGTLIMKRRFGTDEPCVSKIIPDEPNSDFGDIFWPTRKLYCKKTIGRGSELSVDLR